MRTINSLGSLENKTVLVRADFNVPLKDGKIVDPSRINAFKPTLELLKAQNAKIVLVSHLGRPKGEWNKEFSLKPIAEYLNIPLIETPIGELTLDLNDGEVVLLENIRFYPGEKKNDPAFAKQLANLGDVFINDGFSVAHRAHASNEGVTKFLPSAAGLLVETEIKNLDQLIKTPKKPVIGLFGGAKVSTKAPILYGLLDKVETLVVGGAMANTFLKAKGYEVGSSLWEESQLDVAKDLLEKGGDKIVLPIDVVVKTAEGNAETRDLTDVKETDSIMDLGPKSVAFINDKINTHKTLVWNGPFGLYEVPPFDTGTNEIAKHVAKQEDLFSVTGGGDIHACMKEIGLVDKISYASMAGGAFLSYVSGDKLPGIECLKD